jgi:hypothetical protein
LTCKAFKPWPDALHGGVGALPLVVEGVHGLFLKNKKQACGLPFGL